MVRSQIQAGSHSGPRADYSLRGRSAETTGDARFDDVAFAPDIFKRVPQPGLVVGADCASTETIS